jgi:hypothetical protein
MSAPHTLVQLCQKVTNALRRQHAQWRLICPGRVPLTVLPSFDAAGTNLSSTSFRDGYLFDCLGESRLAPGTVHWVFASGSPRSLADLLDPTNAIGQPAYRPSPPTTLRLDGQVVKRYVIPPGAQALYSDHVVIEWTQNDQEYQVSIHRWPNTRYATAQATAMASAIIAQLKRA